MLSIELDFSSTFPTSPYRKPGTVKRDSQQLDDAEQAEDGQDVVRLRSALAQDAAGLATVFVSAWRHAYHGVVSEDRLDGLDEHEIASWLETLIGEGSSTMTVAESANHELLGFCRHGREPEDARMGHVFSLYVRPSSSGRGLGRRLLAHALEDLALRQLDPVTIWVFEKNAPARRLYAGFGFVPDGARRVETEYGAEEIRLRLPPPSTS
jgi:ribosomal protein S18 acetylase RimI-like enzyme